MCNKLVEICYKKQVLLDDTFPSSFAIKGSKNSYKHVSRSFQLYQKARSRVIQAMSFQFISRVSPDITSRVPDLFVSHYSWSLFLVTLEHYLLWSLFALQNSLCTSRDVKLLIRVCDAHQDLSSLTRIFFSSKPFNRN